MKYMLDKRTRLAALIALAVSGTCALANPSGPQVVQGTATFSQPNANTLNVTNSHNAIINWQKFSIGAGQTTNFIQPSRNSAVLNRVISNHPSKILGNLNSNGKVFVVNQHGMMIGAGARINTAGFYASTLNITNEDFLKGNLKFEGGGYGGIQNHGYIHAGPNGNVVLVAPDIENGGVIEVDNGNVILAAGESIRITSLNDAAIEFDVQSTDNSIINLGEIIAKQGAARLFAGNLEHSGSINANGIKRNADGSISLVAQEDVEIAAGATLDVSAADGGDITVQSLEGDVVVAGEISARGESGEGGKIEILGERVGLFGDARVDASGTTGGGEILVGGDFQGRGETQTARQTQVSRGVSLHADAIDSGDGGKVIAWADDFTLFYGEASATGGEQSGDGGFIEISGKETLNFDGLVDTTAANGDTGTVLFDPRNINVFPGSAGTYTGVDDTFAESASTDVSFSNASIATALNSANVVLQANNNISWNGPLTPTGSNDLTLQAGQSVFIFDTQTVFTTNGGNLTLIANSTAADGVVDAERLVGAADIVIGDGVQTATVDTGGGGLVIEIRDGAGITNAQQGSVIFDGLSSTNTFDGALDVTAPNTTIRGALASGIANFSGNLDLREGSFFSNGDVTVAGLTTWNPTDNGSPALNFDLTGSGSFFANGGFDLGNNLNNDTLTLDKLLFIGGPSLWQDFGAAGSVVSGSGILVNGSILDVQNQAQLDIGVAVTNNGEIEKSFGAGLLSFTNFLTMGADSILNVDTGSVAVATTLTLAPGSVLEGFGTLTANVVSSGGTVNIDGSAANTGTLTIAGDLTLDVNSTLVFDFCNDALCTENDQLNVTGDVVIAGNLVGFWADQFTAPSDTTFTLIPNAASITDNPLNVFGPAGVTLSSFANGGSSFDYTMNTVDTGNIIFWSNLAGGNWNLDANWLGGTAPAADQYAVINVASDIITITMDTPETVAGVEIQNNLEILDGGLLTIDDLGAGGTSTITGSVFTLNGTGPGDGLRTNVDTLIAAQTSWNAGDLSGNRPITIHQVGSLNIGPTAGNLDTILLHNSETGSTWSGGLAAGSGAITNTGTIDINGAFGSPIPIDNTPLGTIIKSDAGTTTLSGTVTAGGNFQVGAGALRLTDPVAINGTFDVASGATLQFSGSGLSAGGIFQGLGTVDISTVAGFTTSGLIAPGNADSQIGTLTFNGDLDNIGQILIEIQSLPGVAGVDYDRLVVTGNADLQGFMNLIGINEYSVTNGDTLVPITFGSSTTNTLTFGPVNTETVFPNYNTFDLTLLLGTSQLINWTGGGDGINWTDPTNWDTGGVPGPLDDAVIGVGGFNVEIAAAANAGTLSLASDGSLTQSASTFNLALDSTLQGALTLSGGSFVNGGTLTMDGAAGILTLNGGQVQGGTIATSGGGSIGMAANSSLNGAVLNADLTVNNGQALTILNGLTLNATVTLASTDSATFISFAGTQTLTGTGSIDMLDSAGDLNFVRGVNANDTLTVDTGINISGSGFVGYDTANIFLVNNGTITAGAGETITFNTFTNGPSGVLDNNGGTMNMRGAWDNSGLMTVDAGGAFDLGGTFSSGALDGGKYVNLDGASTTTLSGIMDIGGGNFTITDAITGTGDLQMVLGGEIANGTLLQSGAATLLITPASPFAQLNNITLSMDLDVGNGGTLQILNDLRIAIGRTLTLASTGSATTLRAVNPQSILGNGSIVLGGSGALNNIDSTGAAGTLIIGAGIDISGSGTVGTSSAGLLTLNNGLITAGSGQSIIGQQLSNGATGTLVANGGTIDLRQAWGNAGGAGSMDVGNGGTFDLGGNFDSSAIDAGKYLNSDGSGTTTLTGIMDIQGGTFTITDAITGIGDIELFGGTFFNGTIAQAGSATISLAAGSGNLDSIVVDMDLNITNGRTLTIFNGLSINAGRTITLSSLGAGAFLTFSGSQTLAGSGSVVLDDSVNNGNLVQVSNGPATLTIDSGITIAGGGTVGSGGAGLLTVNNGTITAAAGNTITFNNFTNNGTLNATAGGILSFAATTTLNDGVIDIGAGSTLTTAADLANIPGGFIRGSGTIDLNGGAGTLTNDGDIQPGGVGATGILAIQGNLVMGSTADLELEINDTGTQAGTDYDQLVVNGGDATLDGSLTQIQLNGAPVPGAYRLIDVIGGGSRNGFFGLESLVAGFQPLVYGATFVESTYAAPGLISWDDGAGDGFWNSATNWSGDVVPLIGDDVTIDGIYSVTIAAAANANTLSLASGGSVTLTNGNFTIATSAVFDGDLSISGGTLTGNGNVTVNGNFAWTGGTLAGNGLLTTTGTSTINPAADLTLGRNWTNNGSLTWSSGNITLNNGRTFINTATFNANAGATFTVSSGVEDIDNQGTLNVNSDTAFQGLGGLANSGSFVIAAATTLSIGTGSSLDSGTWTVGDGAVDITGGLRFLNDGFSLSSTSGSLTVSGGSLNVNTTAALTLPATLTVNLSGGSLTGGGDLVVAGGFNWSGGNLTGTGLLTTNAVSSVNRAGGLTLSRDWTNAGTLNWQVGNIVLNTGRTFTNANVFNANAGAFFGVNSGVETFDNQATLNVNSDTTFQGGGSLDNSGSFVIASATTLSIETGVSSDTGTWTIGDGAIAITGGSRTLNDGFSLTSTTGSLTVSGGVLEVNTSSPLTLPATLAFNLSSGALTGSGDIVVDGAFNWTGGSLTGPGLFITNATSTLNQPANLAISRDWLNAGTLNWQAGDIQINSARSFTNSGTFNANADAIFSVNTGLETFDNQNILNVNSNTIFGGGGALDNSGSFVVAAATTLTIGTGSGSESGTWDIGLGGVNIAVGTRTLADGFNAIASGGTLSISGGTLDVNTLSPLTLPAGLTLDLLAGNLTGSGNLVLDGSFNWTGGSVTGAGLLTTNAASLLNQVGGLVLGRDWTAVGAVTWAAGDFTINNNATLISTQSFDANADGRLISLNTGTLFDNQGNFSLGGNIAINNGALFEHNGGLFDLNGFTLTVTGALLVNAGELGGSGSIAGDLVNNGGTIHPGGADTIGSIAVSNNFTNSSGTVVIEIDNDVVSAGTSYDLITVGGQADLNDTLSLVVIGGYTAIDNDVLSPITFGSSVNSFASIIPTGVETVTPDYAPPSLDLTLNVVGGIFWDDGGAPNDWFDPLNWSGDALPALTDDVSIGVFDVDISGAVAVANTITLAVGGSLTLQDNGLEIDSDSTLNGLFTINGGTLDVSGMTLTLTGGLDWNGGGSTISGGIPGGTLVNNGGSTITATLGITTLDNVTLNNAGTFINAQVGANDFRLAGGSLINNAGTFEVQNDVNIANGGGGGSITNTGLITKSGGGGGASFANGIVVDNVGGTITAVGTGLNLEGGGSHSGNGSFTGPVNLSAGTFTIADASTISGNLNVSGAIVNVEGGLSVDTLNVTAGIINVDSLAGGSAGDTLLLSTALNWNGNAAIVGGGSGILDIAGGATANVAGGISSFDALTVDNNGSFVNAQAGLNDFRLENAAVFNNFGSFETINAVNLFSLSANATFNNTGSFITNGNTDVTLGISFVNTGGTVDIRGGILSLNGGVAPLNLDAGSVLTGVGSFNGDVINNGGTIQPGGVATVGTLSITGDFTNTAGTVVIDILDAVTTPGTDYDQLAVANQADFGDTLQLNVIGTYAVANSDTLDPVAYATYGGTPFATIVPVGGEIITPVYTAPDLTLTLSFAGLFTFTGAVDGVWNNPLNWDLGVPGIGNDVLIPAGFNISIAAPASANNLSLAAGSTLDLNSGAVLTIGNGATFDGLFSINAGGFDITGATATVNGGLNWTGTSVITGGILNLNSAFDISGGATNILDGASVNVIGNTTYSGGNLTLANGAVLNTNAVFDFAGDVGIVDGGGATSSFNSFNGATVVKSAGANNSAVDSTVNSTHAGSVVVQTGTLDLNLATLDLGAGDLFAGSGTYVGDVVVNGGTVRPGGAGAVGALDITGDYTHNSGILEVDISAAATFDVLAVSNNATFGGGDIDVNLLGYIPSTADLQPVVTCGGNCSGAFANVTSPTGVVYAQVTNANDLTLDVLSVTFAWDGGGDAVSWTDPLNWSLDVLPDNTIDVLLPAVNVIVDGVADANSLTLAGNLGIAAGGILTIQDSIVDLQVNAGASLTVNGGTLANLGGATFAGGFTLASGNADFTGAATFSGSFDANGGTLNLVGGGTLSNTNNNWRGGSITGGAALVLGAVADDGTTLALSGPDDKTLDTITLDMNLNDIFMSGSGNLVLANNAVVDNTGGTSFNHVSGNGGIIGVGQFNNTDGTYNHFGGTSLLSVDFVNTAISRVNVSGGKLVLQDNDAGDLATYNVGGGSVFDINANRTFGDGSNGLINSNGTVHVSGTAIADMQLQTGEFITQNLVVDSAASLTGDPVTVLSNFLWAGGGLPAALTTGPNSSMVITAPSVVLPNTSNINGDVVLANPAGVNLDLNGNLLQLNNSTLSGSGNIIGDVINASGVVVTGGAGNLDDLQITGNYTQGSNSALVVEVFNNGINTISEQLIVTGVTNLQGGALVIGFETNSLGLVTANFSPLDPQGGISGRFDRIFDAGGNILFFNFNGGVFTILGVSPKIPDAVIDDLISFARESGELAEEIANNRSEAEAVMEELLKEDADEDGLSCKI